MRLDAEAIKQCQKSMGNMPMRVDVEGREFIVYWIRLIEGTAESLLTSCTRHSVYEVEYALRRPLTIQIGNRSEFIPEGSFLVVPPETDHQIICSEQDGIKFILGFTHDCPVSSGMCIGNMETSGVVKDTPMIRAMLDALAVALASHSLYMLPTLIDGVVRAFFGSAVQNIEQPHSSMPVENVLYIQRFMEYVRVSNGIGVTVSGAARLLNISERHLFRLCSEITGNAPGEIIARQKLAYIRTCLHQTRLTLTEIADLAGFRSEYAMSKFFRRYESVTPSAYRRNIKSDAEIPSR